ncbi:MAG: hypothetical protein C5B53_01880 [Candidatus Melainabacteria bacterium]|nr:MAG: hypothetical protein C5B53_01880 [Candidatus Melainabacteria bacterium]
MLGEVLKQQQMDAPPNDAMSIDQSSSLSAAAGDAMNTPVGNMAAGALSAFGFGQGMGQGSGQLTPQQIQQMVPGILNFMMNVMPTPGSTINAGPPAPGYGGFPHFGSNYAKNRGGYPPRSQGMNRVINNMIRRGGMPRMNQMHF